MSRLIFAPLCSRILRIMCFFSSSPLFFPFHLSKIPQQKERKNLRTVRNKKLCKSQTFEGKRKRGANFTVWMILELQTGAMWKSAITLLLNFLSVTDEITRPTCWGNDSCCAHMCEQELIYGEEAISSVNRFCELMRYKKLKLALGQIHRWSEGAQCRGKIATIGTTFDF